MKKNAFTIGRCLKAFGIDIAKICETYSSQYERVCDITLKDGTKGFFLTIGVKGDRLLEFQVKDKLLSFSRIAEKSKLNILKNDKVMNIQTVTTRVTIMTPSHNYLAIHKKIPVGFENRVVNNQTRRLPVFQQDIQLDKQIGKNLVPYDVRIMPDGKRISLPKRPITISPWADI